MRYLILRKADRDTESGARASVELIEAMSRYIEELVRAGVWIDGYGLQPTRSGARVRFADGTPTVTDGPFAETKELIAGVTLIEVASREEAIEWARRWPTLDGGGNVELEVRPLYELEDLGPREAVERLREAGFPDSR